jgi:hypothetical protein
MSAVGGNPAKFIKKRVLKDTSKGYRWKTWKIRSCLIKYIWSAGVKAMVDGYEQMLNGKKDIKEAANG